MTRSARIGLPLAAVTAIALLIPGRLLGAVASTGLVLAALALFDPAALRRLGGVRFWVIASALALGTGLVLARPTHTVGPLPVSLAGLAAGVALLCRAATCYAVAVLVSRHLSPTLVRSALRRVGLARLGEAVTLAWIVMPTLVAAAREAHARRTERGLRRIEAVVVELLVGAARLAAAPPAVPGAEEEPS